MKLLNPFRRKTSVSSIDTTVLADHHTWRTELQRSLKTAVKTPELTNLVDSLENHEPDATKVAATLRQLKFHNIAANLDSQLYHLRAKARNRREHKSWMIAYQQSS